MRNKVFRSTGIILLAALLLHAGVAWAFENCLDDENGTEQILDVETRFSPRATAQPSGAILPNTNNSTTRIHCVESRLRLILNTAAGNVASLKTSREPVLLKNFLPTGLLNAGEGSITQGIFVGQLLNFSLPPSISRHLILSILQV